MKTPKDYPKKGSSGTTLQNNARENQHGVVQVIGWKNIFYCTRIAPECAFSGGILARHM